MAVETTPLAPDASESPAGPQQTLLALLVEEFGLSTAEQLRLIEVQAMLARRGGPTHGAELGRWLSPLFCGSPKEQQDFVARFEELAQHEVLRAAPQLPLVQRKVFAPLREPGRTPRPGPEVDYARRLRRVETVQIVFFTGGLLAVAGLLAVLFRRQQIQLPLPGLDLPQAPDSVVGHTGDVYQQLIGWGLKLHLGVWALLALVPLVLGLIVGIWLTARLDRQRRNFQPSPEASKPVAFSAAVSDLYAGPELLRSTISLARHGKAPGGRLNLRRSLAATVRNAGYPTLRFGGRPKIPAYILLTDQEAPRDHLPLVGDIVARRLREQHAMVVRVRFDRRPKMLFHLDGPDRRLTSLPELLAEWAGARILVLAEADRLVRANGRAADWLADLPALGATTVLNPKVESDWAEDEATLRRAGLAMVPATPDGIRRYADWLATGEVGAPSLGPAPFPGLDLPFQLSRHRAILMGSQPLAADRLQGLICDLQAWLGDDLMRLMRALAVFPRLEPSLTLALGKALKDRRGDPLLSDETLLSIIRLPWLRAGRMPVWLRENLAWGLSRKDLQTTTRMVHAFLISDERLLRHRSTRPPRRPDLLAHWLRTHQDTDLHDQVLIDAIEGRQAADLGSGRETGASRLRRQIRRPDVVSAGLTVATAALVMWLQPLYADVPAETDTSTVEPAPMTPPAADASADTPAADAVEPPKAPVRPPSARASERNEDLAMAKELGSQAMNRLLRLQEGEGTVYETALDALSRAIEKGDIGAILGEDSKTLSQLEFYDDEGDEEAGISLQTRSFVVLFPDNRLTLDAAASGEIEAVTDFIRREEIRRVNVIGYVDASGSNASALDSIRRARAVADRLEKNAGNVRINVTGGAREDPTALAGGGDRDPALRRVDIDVVYIVPPAAAK